MEVMITQANQQEAEEVMNFLETLNENEKKDFSIFLQGAKFMKNLAFRVDENKRGGQ